MKLNPLPENIRGKRLVVVDDSIVRGTTTRQVVAMLREAGATEVHFRVSSPPYRWPCFYGMDTGRRSELLAADLSVGEIRDYLGVDSLAYLELDRLTRATGAPPESFCTACLTGEYPVPVPLDDTKHVLELDVTDARPHRAPSRPTRRPAPRASRRAADGDAPHLRATPASTSRPARRRSSSSSSTSGRRSGPRWSATSAGSAGCSRSASCAHRDPLLVASTDGVGTKSIDRPADRPLRHDRHRLRRDVGRRHRVAGRRAALLPRLRLGRQARARDDRRDRRAASPTGAARPAARCIGGEMSEHPDADGAGRVRSRRLRGRRRRARPRCSRGTCEPGDRIIGIAQPGPAVQRLLARARARCSTERGRAPRRARVGRRAPLARRRAARARA